MKKVNNKQPNNKLAVDKSLIEGAESIIKNMESPALFLSFLCDAISWVDSSRRINKHYSDDVDSWFMCLMIEEVTQPWFAGGKDSVEKMAEGLGNVFGYFGSDACFTNLAVITESFGSYLTGINPCPDFLNRSVSGIKALAEVCNSLADHENNSKKIKAM